MAIHGASSLEGWGGSGGVRRGVRSFGFCFPPGLFRSSLLSLLPGRRQRVLVSGKFDGEEGSGIAQRCDSRLFDCALGTV